MGNLDRVANNFIPFEIRTKLEQKRRDVETRLRGNYGGEASRFHQQQDQDLLDIIEMLDSICNFVDLQDQHP